VEAQKLDNFLRGVKCKLTILRLWFKSRQIVNEAMQSLPPDDDTLFLRKGWLLSPGNVDLPDWFEENRVQGQKRLEINHKDWGFDTPAFLNAAAKFKELGAGAFTRHVKTCSHNPSEC
jgi:hypothetical protein